MHVYVCTTVSTYLHYKYLHMCVCRAASDCTSKLKEANKNHESVVARKDLELKEYQEKYVHTNVHYNAAVLYVYACINMCVLIYVRSKLIMYICM